MFIQALDADEVAQQSRVQWSGHDSVCSLDADGGRGETGEDLCKDVCMSRMSWRWGNGTQHKLESKRQSDED